MSSGVHRLGPKTGGERPAPEAARLPQLEPSEHSGPRSLHTTWQPGSGAKIREKNLLELHLGRMVVVTVGHYSSSASEAAQISGCGGSPTVVCYPAMNEERPQTPLPDPHSDSTTGWGLWKLRAVIGCEEQRGLEPKAVT